ncbi:mono/diheme cytochrome c family protein [Altererythrobacter atlanticus]|uniref:4-cresol dehydrogenase [hydroxylating] cytochrome c subunit n=1 Tax=Croceibacterium atlanticum TaxID=1267766 RepID=A0A0F7KXG7_9SPHN|nr:cytochrome c [Croceibacterium atlanticum]AKH43911.1 4-cresol dehydrogenase [hydroxylating] cytochrome c subunit precursor [Croceibacterium atlanticum]MBB5733639.1 mono/diheme cytochrome c family protein [Croceibacterium atlanticum]
MKRLVSVALAMALTACSQGSEAGVGGEISAAPGGPPPMPQPITLAQRPEATGGEALYVEYCAMCHAPNGMGHGLLGRRMDQPNLELREDLTAEYVVTAARMGIGNMPAIPRGEVSDEQLEQIAEYLAAGPHEGVAQ